MVCTGEPRGDVTLHLHSPLLSSLMSISNETNSNNYMIIKYSANPSPNCVQQVRPEHQGTLPSSSYQFLGSPVQLDCSQTRFPQTRKQSCISLNSIYFLFSEHSQLSADLFSLNLLIFRAVFVFSRSSATLGRNPI